jgi:hypothetical protein
VGLSTSTTNSHPERPVPRQPRLEAAASISPGRVAAGSKSEVFPSPREAFGRWGLLAGP